MENAINAKRLVAAKPGERWLLITSASHMPRAIGLFRHVGLSVEAYPCQLADRGVGRYCVAVCFVSGGFDHLDLAVHEWVALAVDRISGRTSTLFPGP